MDPFEAVWADREENVYRNLFGDLGKGIYTLTPDIFSTFNIQNIDPRWMFLGVFEAPPNDKHSSWLYVSSGLSNPWEDDPEDYPSNEWSGMGVEFVLESKSQGNWAILLMQWLVAYHLALASSGKPLFETGHRVGGGGGSVIPEQQSEITALLIADPDHYPADFKLDSGKVDFFHFIGITTPERDYAKSTSSSDLLAKLKQAGVYPMTDPARQSIV